jgi:hypothetical protein
MYPNPQYWLLKMISKLHLFCRSPLSQEVLGSINELLGSKRVLEDKYAELEAEVSQLRNSHAGLEKQ